MRQQLLHAAVMVRHNVNWLDPEDLGHAGTSRRFMSCWLLRPLELLLASSVADVQQFLHAALMQGHSAHFCNAGKITVSIEKEWCGGSGCCGCPQSVHADLLL